jgi:hypothetical protein
MKDDDDDIQDYVSSGWRKREIALQKVTRIGQEIEEAYRNEVLEEVAKEIQKMTVFGQDTIDSFTVYVRSRKK